MLRRPDTPGPGYTEVTVRRDETAPLPSFLASRKWRSFFGATHPQCEDVVRGYAGRNVVISHWGPGALAAPL